VAFLRARLDEDEGAAKLATKGPWTASGDGYVLGVAGRPGDAQVPAVVSAQTQQWNSGHIARHDPARVLREVRAKRRILFLLEAAQKKADAMPGDGSLEHAVTKTTVTFLLTVAQTMATAYDDHPGYDRAWDPGWETQP